MSNVTRLSIIDIGVEFWLPGPLANLTTRPALICTATNSCKYHKHNVFSRKYLKDPKGPFLLVSSTSSTLLLILRAQLLARLSNWGISKKHQLEVGNLVGKACAASAWCSKCSVWPLLGFSRNYINALEHSPRIAAHVHQHGNGYWRESKWEPNQDMVPLPA